MSKGGDGSLFVGGVGYGFEDRGLNGGSNGGQYGGSDFKIYFSSFY
jgi:hypothetical protein